MEGKQQPQVKRPHRISDSATVCCTHEHSDLVLRGLNEQRQKGLLCDVVLIASGVRFSVHRNILGASSSYFNSMFTMGMRESYQKEVELVGTSAVGCKAVLDFLYGCEVFLDSFNVDYILKTAHLLQIWKLVDLCCEYIGRDLNEENYLQLQELASTYSLLRLDLSIDCFILENFGMLCFTPGFIEKVPAEKLCLYLDSDRIQLKVESDLLKAALQWLRFCPERAKKAYNVLQHIRFSLIPESDLLDLVKPALGSLALLQQKNCQSLIDEAIHYHNHVTAQPVLQNRRSTLRGDGEQLLFLGGEDRELHPVEVNNIRFLDCIKGKWIPATEMPSWRGDFCVAVLGNFIFCAGGYDQGGISNYVFRYDPRCNQWTQVASMNHRRESFYLSALENRLVAIGGDGINHENEGSVEMYNPQKDSWSIVADLPRPTYKHAGATYQQRIYVSGGVSEEDGDAMTTLLCYDYRTDTWEEKRSMNTARCGHSMCPLNERIYAIGGSDGILEDAHQSVECYSPLCNQWTMVAPLLKQTNFSGVAVWRGDIYVLGGMPHQHGTPQKTVQVYDHKKNLWFKGTDLPQRLFGLTACVCRLKQKQTIRPTEKEGTCEHHVKDPVPGEGGAPVLGFSKRFE